MTEEVKSLSEFVPRRVRLSDVASQYLLIRDARIVPTPYGEAAICEAVLADGEVVSLLVSANEPLRAIKRAAELGAFPARAMFVREGRAWRVR